MKKIVLFIVTLFSFVACDLTTLEPAQTKAFMKFYGDEGNTEGTDLLKVNDGYILLGNNETSGFTALLIKVDLNGNQVWSSSFPGIKASAVALGTDGYFIVGDRINSDPQNTEMSLIKTDLEGTQLAETFLGETNIAYHGTAILISSIGEVIIAGYNQNSAAFTDQTFIYGYDTNLIPTWTVRKWGPAGVTRTTSKSMVEDNGNFIWTSLTVDNSVKGLQVISVPRDQLVTEDGQSLLTNRVVTGEIGDIATTFSGGGMIVQTVDGDNNSIAIVNYNNGNEQSNNLISESGSNVFAHTLIRSNGGDYVVLGSTDKHLSGGANRLDTDFYITKVGFDGSVSSTTGFTNIIGGTGNETGSAIVEADDGGFVFLGTMENTNEFKLMVLVKVNNKGELINQ